MRKRDSEQSSVSTLILLQRARQGDASALEELYRRYLARLTRWARGRLPDRVRGVVDTSDLVQQALTKTLPHIHSFEGLHSGALQAYLRHAVLNLIRDELRRKARQPLRETARLLSLDDVPGRGETPLEHVLGLERLEQYEHGLEELREEDRQAVVARIELGMSYGEIAAELDKTSSEAARMAVCRAIGRLTRKIRDRSVVGKERGQLS